MSRTDETPVMRLDRIAQDHGDRAFLLDAPSGRSFSHAEFAAGTRALAAILKEQGVAPGQRIGAVLDNSPEFALLYFAALRAGAVLAPLNPDLSDGELAELLSLGGISQAVADAASLDRIASGALPFIPLMGLGAPPESDSPLPWFSMETLCAAAPPQTQDPGHTVQPDQDWALFFTSGTTGRPKGILHRAGALMGNADTFNTAMGFSHDTRILHVFSMAHMAGFLNTLVCPLMCGGSVVTGGRFGPMMALRFWVTPMQHDVTALWLAPTIMESLVRIDRVPGASDFAAGLEAVMCGTAPLPPTLKEEFETKYDVPVLESYGLTELLLVAANTPGDTREGTVGRVLPGVELRTGDKSGPAEILVRTPHACRAVLQTDRAGAPPPDWFATGDVGSLNESGHLRITDRIRDVIIRGGFNISPRTVEDVLETHPAVSRAAVVGLPHGFYGEQTVAAYIPSEQGQDQHQEEALREHCRKHLAANHVPDMLVPVDDFPLGATGKLHKGMLRERLLPLAETGDSA